MTDYEKGKYDELNTIVKMLKHYMATNDSPSVERICDQFSDMLLCAKTLNEAEDTDKGEAKEIEFSNVYNDREHILREINGRLDAIATLKAMKENSTLSYYKSPLDIHFDEGALELLMAYYSGQKIQIHKVGVLPAWEVV